MRTARQVVRNNPLAAVVVVLLVVAGFALVPFSTQAQSGTTADTLLQATITIGTTSTEVNVKTLTGRSPATFVGWIFENNDAADNVECQFDPAAPAPVIGLKNQMRIKANSSKSLSAFVAREKFRCVAAGDGASLRFETVGH